MKERNMQFSDIFKSIFPLLSCSDLRYIFFQFWGVHTFFGERWKNASFNWAIGWKGCSVFANDGAFSSMFDDGSSFPHLYLDMACKKFCFPPWKRYNKEKQKYQRDTWKKWCYLPVTPLSQKRFFHSTVHNFHKNLIESWALSFVSPFFQNGNLEEQN